MVPVADVMKRLLCGGEYWEIDFGSRPRLCKNVVEVYT